MLLNPCDWLMHIICSFTRLAHVRNQTLHTKYTTCMRARTLLLHKKSIHPYIQMAHAGDASDGVCVGALANAQLRRWLVRFQCLQKALTANVIGYGESMTVCIVHSVCGGGCY